MVAKAPWKNFASTFGWPLETLGWRASGGRAGVAVRAKGFETKIRERFRMVLRPTKVGWGRVGRGGVGKDPPSTLE